MMRLIGRSNKVGNLSAPDRQTDHCVIHLDISQCFSDSLAVWLRHSFLFACASLLTVLLSAFSGFLLVGSLYAGLLLMQLRALDGHPPTFRDLFGRIGAFPGFFVVVVVCALAILTGTFLALVPFVLINWYALLLDASVSVGDRLMQVIAEIRQVSWGFRLSLFSLALGVWYFVCPRIFAGVRCFYMLPLKAESHLPGDEVYVESKKAVLRCGFKSHVLLTLMMLWLGVIGLEISVLMWDSVVECVCVVGWMVFLQPFVLGLIASAYHQTLRVAAHQQEEHDAHVVEMRDELKTARDMQLSLLPSHNPNLAGYDLSDICIPANAVCGDYYTYRWLDDRYFALIAADVCGKAMKAAITAVRFNEMVRYECKGRIDPAEILNGLDASLEDQITRMSFITCCVVVLDTHTNTLEIANAGHCEPCLFSHRTGQTEILSLPGFPLGLARSLRSQTGYEKVQITLEPGDMFVLYSDGVVEAQNKTGEQYEDDRLVALLNRSGNHLNPSEMIDHIVQDVERHMRHDPQSDDISLIVLKRQINKNETEAVASDLQPAQPCI